MAGSTRHFALAALAAIAAFAMPALAEWQEPAPDAELGWTEGKADAPLTVIEYFSPTCSHCREFAEKVLPAIEKDYADTGKVRFVMREWIRNDIDKTIMTQARCLDKEKGLAYLKDVFAKQEDIFVAAQIGTLPGTLIGIGTPYGITDRDAFDTCYRNMDVRFDIQEVDSSGEHYGVKSTPTFVVDGKAHAATVAMSTPEGFSAFLNSQLAGQNTGSQ